MFIPEGGPARLIPGHPLSDRVSDLLAAVPASVGGPNGSCSMWVRETAATEGAGRNVLASVVLRLLAGGPVLPVLGPAVLAANVWHMIPEAAAMASSATCFARLVAESAARLAEDVSHALAGYDDGFGHATSPAEFASAVRQLGGEAMNADIPDDYPWSLTHAPEVDPVAVIMHRLGLGDTFAPVPLRVN